MIKASDDQAAADDLVNDFYWITTTVRLLKYFTLYSDLFRLFRTFSLRLNLTFLNLESFYVNENNSKRNSERVIYALTHLNTADLIS